MLLWVSHITDDGAEATMTLPCPYCGGVYYEREPCCPDMAEQMREQRDEADDQRCNQERDEREERAAMRQKGK